MMFHLEDVRMSRSASSCMRRSTVIPKATSLAHHGRPPRMPAGEDMARRRRKKSLEADLDSLIDEIIVDAYGEDEQLWAFRQAIEDEVELPADAFVIGEPVSVIRIDYEGNPLRGLHATCRKQDGVEHIVAFADVSFPEGTRGARYHASYRKWLGLDPVAFVQEGRLQMPKRHKAADKDISIDQPVELIVLSVKKQAGRCQVLGTEREITLRCRDVWNQAPGEIIRVRVRKKWRYAGHPYLSGEIEARRIDIPALGLVPLRLQECGLWNPADEYWGEEGDPIPDWALPIIDRGPRPLFEMEQVIPGEDPDDPLEDPITQSNDLKTAGDFSEARRTLMDLTATDLRCLDAHCHLGNLLFDHWPEDALRHYAVGKGIGELSLGEDFDGVLIWGLIDNRPYLRCLHGYGLCLWRLGESKEAERIFERLLWLSPSDNLGARFLLDVVKAGKSWEAEYGQESEGGNTMDVKTLNNTPPWEWPEDAGTTILGVLADKHAEDSDRVLAAELAGEEGVVNDEFADALLAIVGNSGELEELRGRAAISLGPALEHADTFGFDDADDLLISEAAFLRIQQSLRDLFLDADVPQDVRRRTLEVSIRAPQEWHDEAVRSAYSSEDGTWKLTAVFCMRFIRGFDDQILESLNSEDPDIHYEAVCAAGSWGVNAALSHVVELAFERNTDKALRIAAIDAVAGIRPLEARDILADLTVSEGEEIVEAVYEALAIANGGSEWLDLDEEDDEEEWE